MIERVTLVRVIPGVEVKVIKEIIPPAPYPSGVVAMIGTAERGPELTPTHLGSWREFADMFGDSTEYTLTQNAKQCFQNGVFEVVATRIVGKGGEYASVTLKDGEKANTVELKAKAIGEAGDDVGYKVEPGTTENTVRLLLSDGVVFEVFDDLVMARRSDKYLVKYVNENSNLANANDLRSKTKAPGNNPAPDEGTLKGGKPPGDPAVEDFEAALERIEAEPEVDMVHACEVTDPKVHALIEAHCVNMSTGAMGRIGIGSVEEGEAISDIIKRTEVLASDRFILVAPHGVVGAVAGLISKLSYFQSPTFKPTTGLAALEEKYTPSQARQLLNAGILPLWAQKGKGIIVIKGITTSKEQINVTRTTDHAVRLVKATGDQFIGTLNNATGRAALKEKITELMLRMENEGAIVPSVDGTEPAFIVDVYSSQLDFAQGIVRVDLAVRPVRAIDYIYATVTVQA
jgi:phage tail sheath protein FI